MLKPTSKRVKYSVVMCILYLMLIIELQNILLLKSQSHTCSTYSDCIFDTAFLEVFIPTVV